MEISVISDRKKIQQLETEWNILLKQSSVNTIFLTWEWVTAWLDSCSDGIGENLLFITVRDGNNQLMGIAPFYKLSYRLLNTMTLSVLRIIGDEGTGGEYPGFIILASHTDLVLEKILAKLKDIQTHWDLIWLPRMSGWDGHKEKLLNYFKQADFPCKVRSRSFSYFDLPESFEEFESSLSSNRRQQFRRQVKKIHAAGSVEIVSCQNKAELPDYLHRLFELHASRRETLGDTGTFKRKPQQVEFYKHFTESALDNKWLWFYALKDNGVVKAIQIGYVYNNIFYQIQEGFDPEYLPGAGNVLRLEVIKQCICQGITGFDFLGGAYRT